MKREKSYKKDLIEYRLELAQEMLRDARLLKENGGSPVSIVNRAYYSVFYAALALLVTADVEPNKHSGVLAKFDALFIRKGIFPKEMSRIIHHAFELRQESLVTQFFLKSPRKPTSRLSGWQGIPARRLPIRSTAPGVS